MPYFDEFAVRWPNFTKSELVCSHCGAFNPSPDFVPFMDDVQILRTVCGFPFPVNCAYRCPKHPIEEIKESPGMHSHAAIDIGVHGYQAFILLESAMRMRKFGGIGVNQSGNTSKRFIHLDPRVNKVIWSY